MVAPEVPGAAALAEAVKEAASMKGWLQGDLEPQSKKAAAAVYGDEDDYSGRRTRVGLSNRSWQEVWRGQPREMLPYSYAAIDATFGWAPGTAWALHHGKPPPDPALSEVERLETDVEALRAEVQGLMRVVARFVGREGFDE